MRQVYLLSLFVIVPLILSAQQSPQYTQYILNQYQLNPAITGSEAFVDFRAGHRRQWLGFEGAPRTSFVSAHAPIDNGWPSGSWSRRKSHHGVGAMAFHDQAGPIALSGMFGSYAYHLKISDQWNASLGFSAGIKQFRLLRDKINAVQSTEDLFLDNGNTNDIKADGSVGIWLYSQKMFFGGAINQLLNQPLQYNATDQGYGTGRLRRHMHVTFGVELPMSEQIKIVPSAMIRGVKGAPINYDFNARLFYEDQFWIGTSYRHNDAISFLVGTVINDQLMVGYAYDFPSGSISGPEGSSHEIVVGYRWHRGDRKVGCPTSFL